MIKKERFCRSFLILDFDHFCKAPEFSKKKFDLITQSIRIHHHSGSFDTVTTFTGAAGAMTGTTVHACRWWGKYSDHAHKANYWVAEDLLSR